MNTIMHQMGSGFVKNPWRNREEFVGADLEASATVVFRAAF
jgi:hypothetical protein